MKHGDSCQNQALYTIPAHSQLVSKVRTRGVIGGVIWGVIGGGRDKGWTQEDTATGFTGGHGRRGVGEGGKRGRRKGDGGE